MAALRKELASFTFGPTLVRCCREETFLYIFVHLLRHIEPPPTGFAWLHLYTFWEISCLLVVPPCTTTSCRTCVPLPSFPNPSSCPASLSTSHLLRTHIKAPAPSFGRCLPPTSLGRAQISMGCAVIAHATATAVDLFQPHHISSIYCHTGPTACKNGAIFWSYTGDDKQTLCQTQPQQSQAVALSPHQILVFDDSGGFSLALLAHLLYPRFHGRVCTTFPLLLRFVRFGLLA